MGQDKLEAFRRYLAENQPVVFIGPYEHHSNEISWRENLATVIPVRLGDDGGIDLAHLEELLQDPAYRGRKRIGSFSAASNVTGIKSPVTRSPRCCTATTPSPVLITPPARPT